MTLAILTARMQSSRLPGKPLAKICGRPCLDWIVDRLRNCNSVDQIVLATPPVGQEKLWAWSRTRKVTACVGDEDDVLVRMADLSSRLKADKVVRITADLPFLSYEGVDELVQALTADVDYVNNVYGEKRYLDGTQAEVCWNDALQRAARMTPHGEGMRLHDNVTMDGSWRLHGMYWMANSPAFIRKRIESKHDISDISHIQLMLDEPNDLKVAEYLMDKVVNSDDTYPTLLSLVRENREKIEALRAS